MSCALVGALAYPALGQEKPKAEAKEMTLARAVVGTGVDNMEPVGAAETFPAATEKVFCFIEASNIPRTWSCPLYGPWEGRKCGRYPCP